jgi:threonine/homoserine/homoserine lactone efflux protein
MMCTSAVSAYSLPGAAYWPSIGILLVAFTAMGLPSVALWTAFGGAFRSSLGDARVARRLRRTLAALTALSCLLIFL